MMKKILIALCVPVLVFWGSINISVFALASDQIAVIDEAGIFGDRLDEVEQAVDELLAIGADVRVRTVANYGDAGNLDRYEQQLEENSPSWTDPYGVRKNNLIVVLISLEERETGIYYGSYWEDALGDNWLYIQSDIMNSYFREGEYATGTVKGLEEIQRLIEQDGQVQPPASKSSAPWWIALVMVVTVTVAVLGFLWHRNRKRVKSARQKALLAKQGAAAGINELNDTLQMLEIKVNVTGQRASSDKAESLNRELAKARLVAVQSSERYSQLAHSAGNPENPKMGEVELKNIESEYTKILAKLNEARQMVTNIDGQAEAILRMADSFPQKAAQTSRAIEEALIRIEQLKKDGYKTRYPAELLSGGSLILEQARSEASGRRFDQALKLVEQADEQIQKSIQATENLPQKKEQAEVSSGLLQQRIEKVKEYVIQGREKFNSLAEQYNEDSWQSVQGNGTEAENRVIWAEQALEQARQACDEQQQEWHLALELISNANSWLDEAQTLISSLFKLAESLKIEQSAAPGEIAAAQADIDLAWDYINKHDDDIRESLEDELKAAENKNKLARKELGCEKPDYFKVNRLAREANEAADRILAQARDEHEAAQRLRAKAASARRDASARVSIARDYINDHRAVVKSGALGYLNRAETILKQAETAVNPQEQLSLATKAEAEADRAYKTATGDVNKSFQGPWPISGNPSTGSSIDIAPILWTALGSILSNSGNWGSQRPSNPRPFGTSGGSSWSSGRSSPSRGGGSTSWGSRSTSSRSFGGSRGGGGSSRW
ncbi:MAG: TPM domain-containing protein [Dehalococcoidales bacterium]|nr:TPM domain-containing protein [Dehalococcoidales bacterium]